MIPAFLLVFSAAAYRITTGLLIHSGATWLSNFTPLAAIALCSAAYFPKKYKFSVPLVTLFISDAVINFRYGAPLLDSQIVVRYVALAVVGYAGLFLQNRASLKTLLPASIAGSTIFYAITNAFSWLSDPGYTKNLAGLIQALTVGLPQLQRHPELDVFPQFAHERSFLYLGLCSVHEPWPKRGGLARPCRGSSRGLSRHAAGGAARRSRDALADAVDSAF